MRAAAVALFALAGAPVAAQTVGPADPSGDYLLVVNTAGSGCPQMYPKFQVSLRQESAGAFALQIGGNTASLQYQRGTGVLAGRFDRLFSESPVNVSGTSDEYQGQKTLDLNLRWTNLDCTASANGGIEGAQTARASEAAPEVAQSVPPAAVIGPAATAASESAASASVDSASADSTANWLARMPFAIKLLLDAVVAILLGRMIGKLLARRRMNGGQ